MTYASRSQHLRLARQISELSQQKFLENLDSDLSGDDADDGGVLDVYGGGHTQGEEFQYAREREQSLKKEALISIRSSKGSGRGSERWKGEGQESSKFSRYMDSMKRGKIGKAGTVRNHTHKLSAARG